MEYDALMKNFDELNEQIRQAKQQMREKSEGLIEGMVKLFLDECPEVTGVHWTQYTPYFNDGEACEFRVNEICFHILEDEDDEIESYESTTLYTQEDLDRAKNDLKVAEEFTKDPDAWRQNYLKEYRKKFGRDYGYGAHNVRPYPYDVARAEERINKIEESIAKYPADVADRIHTNFAKVTGALSKIPDDIMQSIYGDHVMVIINRDGTTVDEFDHV